MKRELSQHCILWCVLPEEWPSCQQDLDACRLTQQGCFSDVPHQPRQDLAPHPITQPSNPLVAGIGAAWSHLPIHLQGVVRLQTGGWHTIGFCPSRAVQRACWTLSAIHSGRSSNVHHSGCYGQGSAIPRSTISASGPAVRAGSHTC
jgi:hypothetical protein